MVKNNTHEYVRIRYKDLKNGNKSIYLDIYVNGKRHYEFLKLYLSPEHNASDKLRNKKVLSEALKIKSKRMIDIIGGKHSYLDVCECTILELAKNKKYNKERTQSCLNSTIRHLERFGDERVSKIDTVWLGNFVDFMKNSGVKDTSAYIYYSKVCVLLKEAYRDGITSNNNFTLDRKKVFKEKTKELEYLTIDELKLLYEHRPKSYTHVYDYIISAFLFSCFTGLRFSDISMLKKEEVVIREGKYRVRKKMKKTGEFIDIALSDYAIELLPECDKDGLYYPKLWQNFSNRIIAKLTRHVGIDKHITFHCARHTFATMELTLGADIYTTSKLLGHKNISTTQVYAKIVDKKKDDAIDLINGII